MLSEELNSSRNILTFSIETPAEDETSKPEAKREETPGVSNGLFERSLPVSFAERFPRFVFCTVAFSILVAAITAEIDCLRGAGYYWP